MAMLLFKAAGAGCRGAALAPFSQIPTQSRILYGSIVRGTLVPASQGSRTQMVRIRLARAGTTNAPFYHVIVSDKRNKRDGRNIERIGFYNPIARGKAEPLRIDLARADYWMSVGAQPSEKVDALIKQLRKQQPAITAEAAAA
jgi:small subunit ribosomal protein S16